MRNNYRPQHCRCLRHVTRYRFSDATRQITTDEKEADYATETLSFGLEQRRILAAGSQPLVFNLTYNINRYAGALKSRSLTTSAQQE